MTPPLASKAPTDAGGFDVAVVALILVALGPLALAAGGVFAALMRSRSRLPLYLAAAPSAAAAWLAWPFARRHVHAALAAVHGGIAAHPAQAFLAAWPSLWPVWAVTTALAPLVALAIVASQPRSLGAGSGRDESSLRRERRVARKAQSAAPPARQRAGLFLGYALGGDRLLPAHRGRVYLPIERLAHHLLVAGATGSGKTETVLGVPPLRWTSSD